VDAHAKSWVLFGKILLPLHQGIGSRLDIMGAFGLCMSEREILIDIYPRLSDQRLATI